MIVLVAAAFGFLLWTTLLAHSLVGCKKSQNSSAVQPPPPPGGSSEAKPEVVPQVQAKRSLRVEKTVEIKMPDDIMKSDEFKDAEDEIHIQKTKEDSDDKNPSTLRPLMVPTKE